MDTTKGNKAACIYEILNTENGNRYIGGSYMFNKRKSRHISLLRSKAHHSKILQADWDKYGEVVFEIRIIENMGSCSEEELRNIEQKYIDELNPFYNTRKKALKSRIGTIQSEAFKIKCSERMKGAFPWNKGKRTGPVSDSIKAKMSRSKIGKPCSDEIKAKLSLSLTGKTTSEETKKRQSESKLKGTANNKPIKSINENGVETHYLGVCDALRKSNESIYSIYRSLNSNERKWSKSNLKWMYL